MSFVLHRAERADPLVRALAGVLVTPPHDPFTPDIVAVHSRGVERWLSHELAARLGTSPQRADGVSANLDFPFPGHLVQGALAAATGIDPATDVWRPERLAWPLLDVVDANLGEDWLYVLAGHLGNADQDDPKRDRRFAAVRHVADLFDTYAVHRPEMTLAWAQGRDEDGNGSPLDEDAKWQAELWRRVRHAVGTPSPAERAEHGCAALEDDPELSDLPERISLFGLTRLPRTYLDVLVALAAHREVHLFALHPSAAAWGIDDPVDLANPILRAWGRDSHEMQIVLRERLGAQADDRPLELDEPPAATLLHHLQAAIRADEAPPAAKERPTVPSTDSSVQVHACHGRTRQAEVVRDAITHLFAADPTLEPRDVVVMCPDIDEFAPLLRAAFDGDEGNPRTIPYRLADRSIRQTNPVLGAVSELIALVDARLTASQVLGFAALEPVRQRFGFDSDDLDRIAGWIDGTGTRWGLDTAHRARYDLDTVEQGTWAAGMKRILLGVAMTEDDLRLVDGVLPYDDVDSADIDLAGRFAELVGRLGRAVTDLADPRPVAEWTAAIDAAADLLIATSPAASWQRTQLDRLLATLQEEASGGGDSPLRLAELRDLIADRLQGQPTRAAFRTGDLTLCTLVPMRSVPHRVVCLVGLDDGAFPRGGAPDGDDLILRHRRPGDHDRRSEDLQLLLDAVLAATDALVVTYDGHDARTNEQLPPAVPLNELLDVIDQTVRIDDGRGPRAVVVRHHPIQPSDVRCFEPGALGVDGPWGFDPAMLAAARAASAPRRATPPFLDGPLPPVRTDVVTLDDLINALVHPTKAFLRQRLGLGLSSDEPGDPDAMPIDLDGLGRWAVGDRILRALLAGGDLDQICAAEVARGLLPPGELGRDVLESCRTNAAAICDDARGIADGPRSSLPVDLVLPDGRQLVGTVPDVVGDTIRPVTYSKLAPKLKLRVWANHLAATTAHPDRTLTSVAIGRPNGGRSPFARFGLDRVDAGRAMALLVDLVRLRDEILTEPLPLACATSAAYADAQFHDRGNHVKVARDKWTSGFDWPKEDKDAEHLLVNHGQRSFDDLLDDPRFEPLARRLWDPLLTAAQGWSR